MSDDKNGVKAFSDERSGFLFELRIKTGKRLIEYEKVSAEQKRARNSDPALLTAGELGRIFVLIFRKPERR